MKIKEFIVESNQVSEKISEGINNIEISELFVVMIIFFVGFGIYHYFKEDKQLKSVDEGDYF